MMTRPKQQQEREQSQPMSALRVTSRRIQVVDAGKPSRVSPSIMMCEAHHGSGDVRATAGWGGLSRWVTPHNGHKERACRRPTHRQQGVGEAGGAHHVSTSLHLTGLKRHGSKVPCLFRHHATFAPQPALSKGQGGRARSTGEVLCQHKARVRDNAGSPLSNAELTSPFVQERQPRGRDGEGGPRMCTCVPVVAT